MANPQKTMTLLINHPEKLFASMKSKTLSNALIVAGISWTAFTTLMTYLLASYFASLQKDAGRLGVMKSIEELNDYRYYANEIKESDKIRA
jgi:phosphate starvation-inducible membrane PsiE